MQPAPAPGAAASRKWRGVDMPTDAYAELAALREQLFPKDELKMKVTA